MQQFGKERSDLTDSISKLVDSATGREPRAFDLKASSTSGQSDLLVLDRPPPAIGEMCGPTPDVLRPGWLGIGRPIRAFTNRRS